MMNIKLLSVFLLLSGLAVLPLAAQPIADGEGDVVVGGWQVDPSAKFEVISTTKGFLLPRMTEVQRDAIVAPANSLVVFNTTTNEFNYYDATTGMWETFMTSANIGNSAWVLEGNNLNSAVDPQLQNAWNGANGAFLGTTSADDAVIATTQNQEIEFWTNNTQRAMFSTTGDFQPATHDAYSLGTDALRWSEVYVNGTSIHVGPDNGEANNEEMEVGYTDGFGYLNVDGGDEEVRITLATTTIFNRLDARSQGNEIGDNTNATQLVIDGNGANDPSAYELIVQGDARVEGATQTNTLNLPTFTTGSVLFIDGSKNLAQDNANFFWDDANNRLGVKINTPNASIHAIGEGGTAPAIRGVNNGGIAVIGVNSGLGDGVFGQTNTGRGVVAASSGTGVGLFANSNLGISAQVAMSNLANANPALQVNNSSTGIGIDVNITNTGGGTGIEVTTNANGADGIEINHNGATGLALDVNGGAIDGDAPGNRLGDGNGGTQLTVVGDGANNPGNGYELVVQGDLNVTGDFMSSGLSVSGDLDMGGNSIINLNNLEFSQFTSQISNTGGDINVADNILPTADNTYSLGTNAFRWSDVFVNGGSVHIGDANGEGTDEMMLGYDGTSTGTIGVNGTTVMEVTTAGVDVTGDVTVSGNLDVNNGLDVTAGNLTVTSMATGGASEFVVVDNAGLLSSQSASTARNTLGFYNGSNPLAAAATTTTFNVPGVTATSTILLTYQDLNALGPVTPYVTNIFGTTVTVTFSGPVPGGANASLKWMVIP